MSGCLLGRDQLSISILGQKDSLTKFAKLPLQIALDFILSFTNAGLKALAAHCDAPILLIGLYLQCGPLAQTKQANVATEQTRANLACCLHWLRVVIKVR